MTRRGLTRLTLAPLLFAACETEFPGTPPPATCEAGDHVCYREPISDRLYVLRCNAGEVDGAIWLVDEVCLDGATCEIDHCVPPGGPP